MPAFNTLNISATEYITELKIYTGAGKQMPIIRKGEGKLDVQNYETGIYFIEITTSAGIEVKKVIIN
ncbi:T9SS type A sorting domain-containing protein [Bacteroidia bacterium]|nr:T9SS type A sorting domain-containing protein [Bacteroidia bacterium]